MTSHQSPITRHYTIGARGSRLSLRQVELARELLLAAAPGTQLDVREIRTEGDRSAAPLSEIGGLGVFTKAIEDALLSREIDIAVHSLKDLPPQLADGLTIGAVPERGDARDVLVTRDSRPIAELPQGARIGTGSERRAVQLRALRSDLLPVEIRGNVDTRIRKVEAGEFDGAVLALAGLERLGLEAKATRIFTLDEMLPAVGQGALAVEVRADDADTLALVSRIDHASTRAAVEAERAFLDRLGAGCRMPVGAYAVATETVLHLEAMLARESGSIRRMSEQIPWTADAPLDDARALGSSVADAILAKTS
ncbi:MAG: hydroxymethylbilane synthase [Chloroflexota bacterium]|nr:hydroxymethylbilane synthase [Chloroflexota bacterium]